MMMLPPLVVSLPFKLIFFVLVDGWWLVRQPRAQLWRLRAEPWTRWNSFAPCWRWCWYWG